MENEQFSLLTEFQYSSEALIYKGKLEAEGIPVFMRNQFIVDANPMFSNAVGGIKMYVRSEDYDQAAQILSEINTYSIDDSGNPITCPNCGEKEVGLTASLKDSKSWFSFIFSALIAGSLPLYTKYVYKCNACKFEFEQK